MSILDSLPPSPPMTSHRHRASLFHISKPATNTPDDSPASLLPSSSGNGSRKRVEFSPWTNVLEGSVSDETSDGSVLKALPKSRDCQTIAKSILKPQSDQQVSLASEGINELLSTATMDSLVQALGNNDKITSLDAYQSLAQLIKTYDEVPEDTDTRSNIATVVRSIRRDLAIQEHGLLEPIDINLVTQALKVTVILVWSEQFSPLLPDDFKIFITDRAVNVLSEHSAPKVVVVHYMHVLATQSFRSALFNLGNRTVKLLEALREITNHVQGKGTMAERLLIYQKLIEQAKPIMKAKAGLWMKEVLLGLCSNVKEIRDKAIAVCSKAVAAFQASPGVSQAARDALAEEGKDRTLSATLTQRLDRMVVAKDEAVQVPQIWALVMLLCGSAESRIDSWVLIRDWLRIIQRCFNCSDINVRVQAFPAWNRFIYIIKPHEASEAMMAMLAKPIAVQIERTGANASSKGSRPAAVSSYCTLLYYAFRPAASHKQYTKAWNEYVVKVATSQFLAKSTANADLCCRVLMALLWKEGSASRIWNEARALDSKSVDPEELPSIDCKWIRAKSDAIFQVFRLLFRFSAWGPSIQHSDQAYVAKAWRAFIKAIRESASKEIKQSSETRKAFSNLVSFIKELCELGHDESSNSSAFISRAQLACRIGISELGPLCLLEMLDPTNVWLFPNPILTETLVNLADTLASNKERFEKNNTGNKSAQKHKDLPMMVQKCLSLVSNQIEQLYQRHRTHSAALTSSLEGCARIIQRLPAEYSLSFIRSLEPSLALVMKDSNCVSSPASVDNGLAAAYKSICSALVTRVSDFSLDQYTVIDDLLASLLSSTNELVANELLQMWDCMQWPEFNGKYGNLLMGAIEIVQVRADINLPGVTTNKRHDSDASQVERTTFEMLPVTCSEAVSPNPLRNVSKQVAQTTSLAARSPQNMDKAKVRAERMTDQPSPRKKRKHDDSQLEFAMINSSPTNLDEVESQLLTDRQKDVRSRQRLEQAVTFADLRSSPIPMANRSSRATSVDCEMARKIAASENLPTTPTLARHVGANDNEEIPSPTPKARHLASYLAEIEVLSSPPSVTVGRNMDVGFTDAVLTISDALDLTDAGVVDLEQMEAKIPGIENGSHPQPTTTSRVLRSSKEATRNDAQFDAAHHKEVVGDRKAADNPDIINYSGILDSIASKDTMDGSQSGVQSTGSEMTTRKRKRTVVNYADISGQHARKRTSSNKNTVMVGNLPSEETSNKKELAGQPPEDPDHHIPDAELESQNVVDQHEVNSAPDSQRSSVLSGSQRHAGRQRKSRRTHRNTKTSNRKASDGLEKEVSTDMQTPQDAENDEGIIEVAQVQNADTQMTSIRDRANEVPHGCSGHIDIMKALETALNGLEHSETAQTIDLKALDDLCFKIRFKAQEIVQRKG